MASSIAAQQAGAPESREAFDARMFDMVSLLESEEDTYFFYKIVSKSMATELVQGPFAYSLEFPVAFLDEHSKKFSLDLIFGMEGNERTWPIKLTVRSFKQSKSRLFAYGAGGWKTFLMDNHIKVGDILIFNLTSFSKFEVFIGRAPVEVHSDDDDDDDMDMNEEEKSSAKTVE